jgi:hypothetical protein
VKGENFTVPAPCLIPLPFWFKPISLFGLVEFTMVQMHLQLPLPWEPGSESDHVQTHETFHRCPLDGLRTSRYRRAGPFHVHLVGEKLRLPSDHELSRMISLPAILSLVIASFG